MQRVSVTTLNTFGGVINPSGLNSRYAAIARYFIKSEVDVINFQEVFTYYHLHLLLKSLKKRYPYHAFQNSYLGPKGGLVTFSKLPCKGRYISYKRNFIPTTIKSSIELLTQRGALVTKVKNLNFTILNTHMTAVLNGDWSRKSKYYNELSSEIKQFHKIVENAHKNGNVLLASGDFNIAKASQLYKELISYHSLVYPFKNSGVPTKHSSFPQTALKTNCVDYIFVFSNAKLYSIEKKKYVFTRKMALEHNKTGYVSDHIGLYVQIKLTA